MLLLIKTARNSKRTTNQSRLIRDSACTLWKVLWICTRAPNS